MDSDYQKLKRKREAKETKSFGKAITVKSGNRKPAKKNSATKKQSTQQFKVIPLYKPFMGAEFYSTKEWRELRFQVIRESDGSCVYCGRTVKQHKIVIHVDHKKPRSKFPSLELDKSNLQVTCEDCNLGKGASI